MGRRCFPGKFKQPVGQDTALQLSDLQEILQSQDSQKVTSAATAGTISDAELRHLLDRSDAGAFSPKVRVVAALRLRADPACRVFTLRGPGGQLSPRTATGRCSRCSRSIAAKATTCWPRCEPKYTSSKLYSALLYKLAALELEAPPADRRARLFVLALGHGELREKLGPTGQHGPAAPGRVGRPAWRPSVLRATAPAQDQFRFSRDEPRGARPRLPVRYPHVDLCTSGRELDQLACPTFGRRSGTCASVSASSPGSLSVSRARPYKRDAIPGRAAWPPTKSTFCSSVRCSAVGRDRAAAAWPRQERPISPTVSSPNTTTRSGMHGPCGADWIDAHTVS